tara:strand:+ start:936 stop:1148 length:213 start_codon:yes stop_codon:yes gene_type:complete
MIEEKEVSRYYCITEKVKTPFGKVYSHVDFNQEGKAVGTAFSFPCKFEDTSVGDALEELSQSTRDIIREV